MIERRICHGCYAPVSIEQANSEFPDVNFDGRKNYLIVDGKVAVSTSFNAVKCVVMPWLNEPASTPLRSGPETKRYCAATPVPPPF
jgi:hypothetical protein